MTCPYCAYSIDPVACVVVCKGCGSPVCVSTSKSIANEVKRLKAPEMKPRNEIAHLRMLEGGRIAIAKDKIAA